MLKMILADDESIVRDGLHNIIEWKDYDIEIVAEASDGQETYDLCMKLMPDILFTDIRMPFMDGLEVATKLKENGNDLKVIIFSGIQDFGYAKSALNINAEGYILKPLDVDELIEVINKVVKKIKQGKNLNDKVQHLRQQLHENFGAAREKFLRHMALGVYKKENEILEKLNYFQNPINANESISVAVLQIDDYSKLIENYNEEDKQLLIFSITNIAEELINNSSKGICVVMGDNEQLLLFNNIIGGTALEENDIFLEIVSSLNKYLNISVSIGVGRKVDNVLNINAAYKDAVNALYFKFYTGKGSIINISDISLNFESKEFPNFYSEENEFVNLVKSGNVDETKNLIQNLFTNFTHDKKYTIEYLQRICGELVYTITRSLYELGENVEEVLSKRTEILNIMHYTESIFDLQEQITSVLVTVATYFSKKYTQKNNKVISDIKKIIGKRYMEDLNINKIAESVYLSPNYISLIFKQETGETIIDYLTKTRMEEAKILLKETDFKIFDISEMVGFQDSSYFSKVFKKYTGIHPQKFRTLQTLE